MVGNHEEEDGPGDTNVIFYIISGCGCILSPAKQMALIGIPIPKNEPPIGSGRFVFFKYGTAIRLLRENVFKEIFNHHCDLSTVGCTLRV